MEPESREGQRVAPPSEQPPADKEKEARGHCRTAGPRPPEGSSLVSQARRTPKKADKSLIARQNCSPGRNSWNLRGKATSVQTPEPKEGNKNPWYREENKTTGGTGHVKFKRGSRASRRREVNNVLPRGGPRPQALQSASVLSPQSCHHATIGRPAGTVHRLHGGS